jgi:hypothetical protein
LLNRNLNQMVEHATTDEEVRSAARGRAGHSSLDRCLQVQTPARPAPLPPGHQRQRQRSLAATLSDSSQHTPQASSLLLQAPAAARPASFPRILLQLPLSPRLFNPPTPASSLMPQSKAKLQSISARILASGNDERPKKAINSHHICSSAT